MLIREQRYLCDKLYCVYRNGLYLKDVHVEAHSSGQLNVNSCFHIQCKFRSVTLVTKEVLRKLSHGCDKCEEHMNTPHVQRETS